MSDFFFRTEDIGPANILDYFVETDEDRSAVEQLKGRNPTVLIGSRGVGKSFLMRVAEQELVNGFQTHKVVPVYVTFVSGSLLRSGDPQQFRHWMLARICRAILRKVQKMGLLALPPQSANVLAGLPQDHSNTVSRATQRFILVSQVLAMCSSRRTMPRCCRLTGTLEHRNIFQV